MVDYVISNIPLHNEIINFDILNDHEPNLDHRDLIEDNPLNKINLIFDRNKNDIFLNELKKHLLHLSSIDNIEDLYHNFTTTLSYSINKFSIEVSSNKINSKTNRWNDKDCKVRGEKLGKLLMSLLKLTT